MHAVQGSACRNIKFGPAPLDLLAFTEHKGRCHLVDARMWDRRQVRSAHSAAGGAALPMGRVPAGSTAQGRARGRRQEAEHYSQRAQCAQPWRSACCAALCCALQVLAVSEPQELDLDISGVTFAPSGRRCVLPGDMLN